MTTTESVDWWMRKGIMVRAATVSGIRWRTVKVDAIDMVKSRLRLRWPSGHRVWAPGDTALYTWVGRVPPDGRDPDWSAPCWRCATRVDATTDTRCPTCGWLICLPCGACYRLCRGRVLDLGTQPWLR